VRVPKELESIIFKSLEKTRDTRYRTAADFAAALESIRASIPPDQKYGVGERMVTLSAAKTLADLPKYSPTGGTMAGGGTMSGGTQQTSPGTTQAATAGGTRAGSNEATVMERGMTSSSTPAPQGSNEATVMDRFGGTQAGGAAPTAMERKAGWAGGPVAEPTVMERQVAGEPKKKSPVMFAIAAAVVIAIGIGAFLMMRKTPEPIATTTTAVAPTTTQVTTTATQPPSPGEGLLLLSATPWGDLQRIVHSKSGQQVRLGDDEISTPARISLAPGNYEVTLNGPNGKTMTVDVEIEAGKRTVKTVPMGQVNMDELEKEMNRP
jgi:hypothetical protein